MKYMVGITQTSDDGFYICDVINWCRDMFGIESKNSYPMIIGPPYLKNPRWSFHTGLKEINDTYNGFTFKFKYKKDIVLFKLRWL